MPICKDCRYNNHCYYQYDLYLTKPDICTHYKISTYITKIKRIIHMKVK